MLEQPDVKSIPEGIRVHACLMLLAWGFCCPNGLLVTRHFKTEWPGRSFRKLKYWFTIHLLLQCFLLAFVIVAFMSVVVQLTGYSKLTKLPFSAHPALGFLAFFLTILGPFHSWMMITSTESRRSLFRNFHLCFGVLAHTLSVPLILIGFNLPTIGTGICSSRIYSGMYLSSLMFYAITEVVLEVVNYRILSKTRDLREKFSSTGLDVERVRTQIAHDPRHAKERAVEVLIDKPPVCDTYSSFRSQGIISKN
ncbi:hypothetical protein CRM22_004023 [Opisthorchis felineus]|uniref:ascorbate ferrireductase (transmembrane) n=1 Tax=Opisthorchis felineus TaxID=147828 RepID=A0A4S2LYB6_OPIFE|nr:hypothetical protein CRM22_004023 [Opisthorchis felineus]